MAKLEETIKKLDFKLRELEKKQDKALALQREIVRLSAKGIREIHLNELKECVKTTRELEKKVRQLKEISEFKNIAAGALQEFVEIHCLLAILNKKEVPSYQELNVNHVVWLAGLSDCVGELRRAMLIALKNNDEKTAERNFQEMERIYDNLMLLKYAPSLVGQLKRKQDSLRGIIEASRSDLLRLKT
ncbi:MAG: hypothetical protein ABH803_00775 [Candidatus Micrarchaeota archaeon]